MKEKKVIDYTRTYRRIEADKKKCILYIVILILLGFLLMWTQIANYVQTERQFRYCGTAIPFLTVRSTAR